MCNNLSDHRTRLYENNVKLRYRNSSHTISVFLFDNNASIRCGKLRSQLHLLTIADFFISSAVLTAGLPAKYCIEDHTHNVKP